MRERERTSEAVEVVVVDVGRVGGQDGLGGVEEEEGAGVVGFIVVERAALLGGVFEASGRMT